MITELDQPRHHHPPFPGSDGDTLLDPAPVAALDRAPVPAGPRAVWIAAGRSTATNELLVGAFHERGVRAERVEPTELGRLATPGDVVFGRLDVAPTLDGVEDGLWELRRVERRGIAVLNRASTLLACHDKLQTVLRLARVGIPQPATAHVDTVRVPTELGFPVVVKPRFGSWGRDIVLCATEEELTACLKALGDRAWFRRQGALVQELVPPADFDLRLVVAGGRVVGAVERVAARGEWRTNIALGGTRRPVEPCAETCALAVAAASAVEGDIVGVDLLPVPGGGWSVLEVNGAVDFTSAYSLAGQDVFEAIARVVADATPDLDASAVGLPG